MPDLKVTDDSPQRVGYFDELDSPNTAAYTLPREAGTSGQVITINADGNTNFQSVGSITALGSIDLQLLPYIDEVNSAADDWNPAGKSITPIVYVNLSFISYNPVPTNNTWRYDGDWQNLTFTGGTQNTGVSAPALEFATHVDGNTNPTVTGDIIYRDAGGTDYNFSFTANWILVPAGAAGEDGAVGVSARGVTLTASDQSIQYDKDGTNPTPSSVTVSAEAINASETEDVYFEFFVDDVSQGAPAAAGNDSPFAAEITLASATTIGNAKKVEVQIREGLASNPILARDQIVIFPIKEGSDAITIILTNEAHTLPTTNGGEVTYAGSGTDIEVYEGANQLGYDDTAPYPNSTYRVSAAGLNVEESTQVSTVTDTSPLDLYSPQTGYVRRYGPHDAMTANTASVVYTITVTNDEGKETEFRKIQSLAKSIQGDEGASGADGKTVKLTSVDQVFEYDTNGANPTPSSTTITATAANTEGTVYYEFFKDDVSVQGPGTGNTYSYTPQAARTNMPDKIEVEITDDSSNSPPDVVARDQLTVFGVQQGTDAIIVAMDNEAHVLQTTNTGEVTYTGSGTSFDVYEGATQLEYDDSASPVNSSYRISAAASNITISTPTTSSKTRIYGAHDDMTVNAVKITYTITVKRADSTEETFTRTQSLSKSIQGDNGADGVDAAAVKLIADTHVIPYATAGDESPETSVGFTTEIQSITNPYYEFYVNKLDGSGDVEKQAISTTSTFTLADGDEPAIGKSVNVKVKVYEGNSPIAEGPVAIDSVSIYAVQGGSDAVIGFLTNAAHVVVADSSGTVSSFTGAGGTYKVFVGNTDVTTSCTFSVSSETGVDVSIGASTGVYTVSSMSANQGTATFQAVIPAATAGASSDVTIASDYSISKSIEGAPGAAGAAGDDGDDGKQTASGLVYYVPASGTAPSNPPATSYNFATRTFTGLTSNWQTTPVEVLVTNTTLKYWTSRYDVTETSAGGGTGTPSFSTPTSSINFGDDIQSDTYIAGSSGWQIQRDTGDAEFNNVTARGALLGGKTGPTDFTSAGFYIGPGDGGSGHDFLIGNSNNQLRFDGSAGDLTFSSGSGQEQVEISSNKIEFGDNFKLVYDSGGGEHQLYMSTGDVSSGIPLSSLTSVVTPGITDSIYKYVSGSQTFNNRVRSSIGNTASKANLSVDIYGVLLSGNRGTKYLYNGLEYYEGGQDNNPKTETGTKLWSFTDNVDPTLENYETLGSTQYDERILLSMEGHPSSSRLIFSNFRDGSGSDWTTAGGRIQQKVGSYWMGYMQFNGNGNQQGISFGTGTGLNGPEDATERMRITAAGEVYIAGGATPTDRGAYNLQVNGTGVWGAGAYVNGSDERLKENIEDIDSCLDIVNNIRPVTFTYKESYSKDQNVQTGFIAQELSKALENTNYVDGVVQSGSEHLNVAYQSLIPILTKAIQEQQIQIVELQKKLKEIASK